MIRETLIGNILTKTTQNTSLPHFQTTMAAASLAGYFLAPSAYIIDSEWDKIVSVFSIVADMNSLMPKRTSEFHKKMMLLIPEGAKLQFPREVSMIYSILMTNTAGGNRPLIAKGLREIADIIGKANSQVRYFETTADYIISEIHRINDLSKRISILEPRSVVDTLILDIARIHYAFNDPLNISTLIANQDYNMGVTEAEKIPIQSYARYRALYAARILSDHARGSGPFKSGFFQHLNDVASKVVKSCKDNATTISGDSKDEPEMEKQTEAKKLLDFRSATA